MSSAPLDVDDPELARISLFCTEVLSKMTIDMFDVGVDQVADAAVVDNKRKREEDDGVEEVLDEGAAEEQGAAAALVEQSSEQGESEAEEEKKSPRRRRVIGRRGKANTSAPMEAEARLFASPPNLLDMLVRGCVVAFGDAWVPLERVRALASVIGYTPRSNIFRNSWIMRTSRYGRNSERRTTSEPFGHFFPYWDVSETGKLVKLAPEFFQQQWPKPVEYKGPPVPTAAEAVVILAEQKRAQRMEAMAKSKSKKMKAASKEPAEVRAQEDKAHEVNDEEIEHLYSSMKGVFFNDDIVRLVTETPASAWEEVNKEMDFFKPVQEDGFSALLAAVASVTSGTSV